MSCTCVVVPEWHIRSPHQWHCTRTRLCQSEKTYLRRCQLMSKYSWRASVKIHSVPQSAYSPQSSQRSTIQGWQSCFARGPPSVFIKKKIGSRFARRFIRKVYLPGQLIYVWTFFFVSLTGWESLTPTCRFMIKETIMPINSRSGIMSLVRRPVCGDCLASPSFCSN